VERDWTYFALMGVGVGVLWLLHRRRGGQRRGIAPIVAAILAVIAVLYFAFGR
jgi:bacteriorhodopsin